MERDQTILQRRGRWQLYVIVEDSNGEKPDHKIDPQKKWTKAVLVSCERMRQAVNFANLDVWGFTYRNYICTTGILPKYYKKGMICEDERRIMQWYSRHAKPDQSAFDMIPDYLFEMLMERLRLFMIDYKQKYLRKFDVKYNSISDDEANKENQPVPAPVRNGIGGSSASILKDMSGMKERLMKIREDECVNKRQKRPGVWHRKRLESEL